MPEEGRVSLKNCDVSSLAIDSLCKQAVGGELCRCVLLLRLRRSGGAIPGYYSGFSAETGCWWAG